MKPQAAGTLMRAIGSEFLRRKLRTITIVVALISIVVLLASIWLVSLSAWWLLLVVPVAVALLLTVIACGVAAILLRFIRPSLSKAQTAGVALFVDKLERVADALQTPVIIIFFQVLRDVIRPRQRTFIQSLSEDSATLRADFAELRQLFA